MKRNYLLKCASLSLAMGGLMACGGGGGSDTAPGPAAISSVGTITGFGSIYVNGIEFETDSATYDVDDVDQFDDSALAVGMKVRVDGTVNTDGRTGTASRILYDDDVEGPIDTGSLTSVDASTKVFTILGLSISVDAARTVFDDGASFENLIEGQELEVSGYFDGSQIVATRIEKQNDLDDEFELKGVVASYDGSTITLTLQNGATAGPFNISGTAEVEIPTNPTGLFVELKLEDQGASLLVIKIETDDDDLLDDNDGDVSIRGILASNGSGGFLINGVSFISGGNTEYEPATLEEKLVAGLEVKVEGHMQGGVLIAERIETEDGDIEIQAQVISVSASDAKNGTVTLDLGNSQTLTVHTDNGTQFEDDSSADFNDDDSFNLSELVLNTDFVEIEAYQNASGQLIATSIERNDAGQDTRLEGPVDSYDANVSVTILGITYTVDGGTTYEVNDIVKDAPTFFGALNPNDTVKVKDVEPDGTAEELDLED